MRRLFFLSVVMVMIASASILGAQDVGERMVVLRVAAGAVREHLPRGAVAVDPQIVGRVARTVARPTHASSVLLSLQHVLGGTVERTEDIVQCGASPRTCRFREGVAVVAFGTPTIVGDTATVSVLTAFATSSERMPVAYQELRVVLVRTGAVWRAVKTIIEMQT